MKKERAAQLLCIFLFIFGMSGTIWVFRVMVASLDEYLLFDGLIEWLSVGFNWLFILPFVLSLIASLLIPFSSLAFSFYHEHIKTKGKESIREKHCCLKQEKSVEEVNETQNL